VVVNRALRFTLLGLGLAVFVASVAVFYGIEWRFYADHKYVYLRSDWDEVSDTLGDISSTVFFGAPLALGAIVYAGVVLASPAPLRRTRWRYLIGLPLAALAAFALWVVLLAPWFFYPDRPS
jgi:hypothetical protein